MHTDKRFVSGNLSEFTDEFIAAVADADKLVALRKEYHREEERMSNEEAHELERCIECGCCIGSCGTANIREDFVGADGLNRIARFMIDPRDERQQWDDYEVVGTDDGTFGCMGLMSCDDICP